MELPVLPEALPRQDVDEDGNSQGHSDPIASVDSVPCGPSVLFDRLTVETRNKDWHLTIFGALTGEVIFSEQRPIIPSAILLLSPYTGRDTPTAEIHGKQTSLGFRLSGPEILGMQSGGLVLTSFYGESLLEDKQGLFIPRAYAELKNDRWRFAVGALGDIINPLVPGSLDFLTGQAGGNLGAFRGQFRIERYIQPCEGKQWTLQAGMGNPLTTSFEGDLRELVEDNGWPNLECRIMLGLGPLRKKGPFMRRPFEIGVSALGGQIRKTGTDFATFDVWAVGSDARVELLDHCGVKAEFFHGQSLGNYNAGILQIYNPITLEPVVTTGGWVELFIDWTDNWHSSIAMGVDDPLDRRLSPGLPSRNQFSFANLTWDVKDSLQIGFQVGHYETNYLAGGTLLGFPIRDNDAMVYRTRVQLKY